MTAGIALPLQYRGFANAGIQSEGETYRTGATYPNEGSSIWLPWSAQRGRIDDNSTPNIANAAYELYDRDFAEHEKLNCNATRVSIEWWRIEPTPGKWDEGAMRHYEDVIASARKHGQKVMATFHHFSHPLWVEANGGATWREFPERFAKFVRRASDALGDGIEIFCTVNEPNIFSFEGHITGSFPPGERNNPIGYLRSLDGLLEGHAAAAREIRLSAKAHQRGDAPVTFALAYWPVRPFNPTSNLSTMVARPADYLFNRVFLESCLQGKKLAPLGLGEKLTDAHIDLISINFYAENLVDVNLGHMPPVQMLHRPDVPINSYGWPVDGDALRRAVLDMTKYGKPIVVSENGVADKGDLIRQRGIAAFLTGLGGAMAEGADVRGYFHWTSEDNWEWARGFSQQFGVYAVDRNTMQRTPKPSAAMLGEVFRTGFVRSDLATRLPAYPGRQNPGLSREIG